MGHTQFDSLLDLTRELDQIRSLDGIREKKPGIFYLKAIPFLHFHDKDGIRWADIKSPDGWIHHEIAFEPKAKARSSFVKEVKAAYLKLLLAGRKSK